MNPGIQSFPVTNPANYDTAFLRRQSAHVLIQQKGSQRYLAGDGDWTDIVEEAATFRSGSAAMEVIVKRKLAKVQLVLTREIRVSEVIAVETLISG
jgi:hypothetical protein